MKKQIIIIALVVVIAIAIYAYLNPEILEKIGLKKAVVQGSNPAPGTTPGTSTTAVKQDKNGFPLMEGKSGSWLNPSENVKALQSKLNADGANLVEEGIYGPYTAKALKSKGLPAVFSWIDYTNYVLGITD